jgi:hypothetical protein
VYLYLKRFPLVWIALLPFTLMVIFVNPIRHGMVGDSFAYALPAEHLYRTGEYIINEAANASSPFLAYWGMLFMRLFGPYHFSFYLSEIALVVLSLIAFYHLALIYRFSPLQAAILTLFLASSTLYFSIIFGFFTDAPFLALLIIALYLYVKAIRMKHYGWMLAASLVGTAAVLTRQFGIVLLIALGLSWLFDNRRRGSIPLYLLGGLFPLLGALLQTLSTFIHPTWTLLVLADANSQYHNTLLTRPHVLLKIFSMRGMFILQYMALFSAPLILVEIANTWEQIREWQRSDNRSALRQTAISLTVAAFFVLGAMLINFREHGWAIESLFLPYLEWSFYFELIEAIPITLFTTIGSILFIRVLVLRYSGWNSIPGHERFVDYITWPYVLILLVFYKLGDRYLLSFLPFAVLAMGHSVRRWLLTEEHQTSAVFLLGAIGAVWLVLFTAGIAGASLLFSLIAGLFTVVIAGSLLRYYLAPMKITGALGITLASLVMASAIFFITASSTRVMLNEQQAAWEKYDEMLDAGVDQALITDDYAWQSYHGAFDEFIRHYEPEDRDGYERYFKWLTNRYHEVDEP